MTNQEAIKTAPDVVKIHHYEGGRLTATEYKSSLGTALERHGQESKSEVLYAEDGTENTATEEKPKRR